MARVLLHPMSRRITPDRCGVDTLGVKSSAHKGISHIHFSCENPKDGLLIKVAETIRAMTEEWFPEGDPAA